MSLKLGNIPIAGISQNTKYNAHSLFDCKWADHKLNEISWLEASTFSWQSGDVYVTAYNHLVQDIQGITSETETIGSYTVTFYRATDGHKICLADQEQTVLNIYNTYGIAWYYILDTTNTQFKLPRTKWGFKGLRTNVGDMITAGLPNITGYTTMVISNVNYPASGAFSWSGAQRKQNTAAGGSFWQEGTMSYSANRSSSIYGNSNTVQEQATQMYLYFYVGDYSQTAIEQTAGLNAELFNNKVDLNFDNMNPSQTAKNTIIGWGMPDYSAGVSITSYTSSSNQFTAPCDGIINWGSTRTSSNKAFVNNLRWNTFTTSSGEMYANSTIPIRKGDKFYATNYNDNGDLCNMFFPMKGAN